MEQRESIAILANHAKSEVGPIGLALREGAQWGVPWSARLCYGGCVHGGPCPSAWAALERCELLHVKVTLHPAPVCQAKSQPCVQDLLLLYMNDFPQALHSEAPGTWLSTPEAPRVAACLLACLFCSRCLWHHVGSSGLPSSPRPAGVPVSFVRCFILSSPLSLY